MPPALTASPPLLLLRARQNRPSPPSARGSRNRAVTRDRGPDADGARSILTGLNNHRARAEVQQPANAAFAWRPSPRRSPCVPGPARQASATEVRSTSRPTAWWWRRCREDHWRATPASYGTALEEGNDPRRAAVEGLRHSRAATRRRASRVLVKRGLREADDDAPWSCGSNPFRPRLSEDRGLGEPIGW